jgi:hypothetical protein
VHARFRPLHGRASAIPRADEDFADFQPEALLSFGDDEIRVFTVVFQNPRLAQKLGCFLDEETLAPFLRWPCHC